MQICLIVFIIIIIILSHNNFCPCQGHLIYSLQPASLMTWRVWTKFLILIVSLTPNKEDHSGIKVLSFIWDDKLLVFWHSTLTSEVKHEDEFYCRCSHERKCLWFFILFQNVISIICCELGTVYFCDLSYMKLLYLIENH